jgi:hypothetical protein
VRYLMYVVMTALLVGEALDIAYKLLGGQL